MSDELEVAGRSSTVDRWSRSFPLTAAEHQTRRRNRRWLLLVFWPSVALLVLALIASGIAASHEPSGPKIGVPAGYKAVNDGYFSYAVPSAWTTNPTYTDAAGDVDTSGTSGWAAEHIDYRSSAPAPGETPPVALEAFGIARPEPYTLGNPVPVTIKGASNAYSYDATRPGGFRATVVDAWNANRGVELWLMLDAPAGVTSRILSTLQG